MRYQGGKSRIAAPIAVAIERERERESSDTFVSLFCGSCVIESKLAPNFKRVICNDKHKYLIEMFKALQNGYNLPENITEEQYKYIREHKDENPALTGFVGFGCSFGGKWFGGYARNNTNTNYALQSKRSVMKDIPNLMNAKFTCLDYKDVVIPNGSIVYADPPYANTTTYQGQKFDTNEFWGYMREISKDNKVFISEQNAPDDFECIWEKPFTRTLDRNKNNQFKVTEKLFTYKNWILQ